ncbi:MAG: TlpA family protein disulfide reductase [Bacteroidetes bacterium]|nr:TlpA family protein disulfide reductase [Rhodothermia bacterium]MCS7154266.1 TlpA family protein disulfide reductase [Bacteroidota bacterium]MCX7906698.1 TlpA family protein disulfide reductase [Bacteroidota bacterium]MDW8137022.1 TlpA disulfide reductase family protein [Bacteroidota bacterium]MDW8285107.1 TlpA disulfide reductase family protein [Bacteroidota bacterium]
MPLYYGVLLLLALGWLGCARSASESARSENRAQAASIEVLPVTAEGILAEVRKPEAAVTLVNLWATWCQPCVEEFPDLVRLARAYRERGLRVMFVSVDFDSELEAVRRFLAEQGVDFPTYIKAQDDDNAFINALNPDWSGAIPATLVFDRQGRLRHFHEGKADYATFERMVQEVLSNP